LVPRFACRKDSILKLPCCSSHGWCRTWWAAGVSLTIHCTLTRCSAL
jgi:hypothetical protein